MFNIKKVVYNHNLRTPDSITVECGRNKKTFSKDSFEEVEKWLVEIWTKERVENKFDFVPLSKARVFYNIDWDSDNVLYCEYTAA